MDDKRRLTELEGKLAKYRPVYEEKKRLFRGVRHEDSLSELRYTEFKVYQELVNGLMREIAQLKRQRVREK